MTIRVRVDSDQRAVFGRRLRNQVADALRDIGDACLQEANLTVPLEEGILSQSGFVEVDRDNLDAQVAYSTPYAVVQHEDTTLNHDPGREDHWLEKTVDRNRDEYARYLASKVD